MNQEQIKQNALKYATDNYGGHDEHDYTDSSECNLCNAVSEKVFITGVHSRDKEMKELKNKPNLD